MAAVSLILEVKKQNKTKPEAQKGETTGPKSHTSSSHLQVRAGKENPRVSVGEGGLS